SSELGKLFESVPENLKKDAKLNGQSDRLCHFLNVTKPELMSTLGRLIADICNFSPEDQMFKGAEEILAGHMNRIAPEHKTLMSFCDTQGVSAA
ncbi:hypothetical protein ABTM75_19150, partial [Acinetobacter baumannii]